MVIDKMGKETIMFGDTEVEKHKFHQNKNRIPIYNVNTNRIAVCNMVPFGKKSFKYFTGYEDISEKNMSLCVLLPKNECINKKFISFLIKDNELLEKHNEIWDKIGKVIEKGFESEPAYIEKQLKTKIKPYEGKLNNANFYNDKIPKDGSHCICLSMNLIDSVFKIG